MSQHLTCIHIPTYHHFRLHILSFLTHTGASENRDGNSNKKLIYVNEMIFGYDFFIVVRGGGEGIEVLNLLGVLITCHIFRWPAHKKNQFLM